MREFDVRFSDQALADLESLRLQTRSAARRQKHDDVRFLLTTELAHDADLKGWPHSANRLYNVIDEYPLRFVFWADHPNVWIIEVLAVHSRWWHGLE